MAVAKKAPAKRPPRKAPAKKITELAVAPEVEEELPVTPTSDASTEVTYARVQALVNGLLDEAEFIMKHGTTQTKIALMKQVVPVLMKELQNHQEATASAAERAEFREVMAGMREQIGGMGDG